MITKLPPCLLRYLLGLWYFSGASPNDQKHDNQPKKNASASWAWLSFLMLIALYFEHFMGLHPCKMCIWQRIPHIVIIGLGLLSFVPNLQPLHRPLLVLMSIILLIGAGIAFWHSGVELKIFSGPASCSAGMSLSGDPSALLDQILAAPIVPVRRGAMVFPEPVYGKLESSCFSFGMMITAVVAFFQSKSNINQDNHNGV